MRGTTIFIALGMLAGCATGPSLEELEAQALITGDWSLVERREAQLARRDPHRINCPSGSMSYCESTMAGSRCGCISDELSRVILGFSR